ncbi:MAG TPA: AmmeMemoRadiSam system radical SAM enzyme [Candidatus Rifleibacterium sp.]|nr:AmmeMemoRadiSam system radical SAM enzyme [Candidatus Rifleibacterium sp.]
MHEAAYYKRHGDNIECLLCPNHCLIAEGDCGDCLSRGVVNHQLQAHTYARLVSASVDPIEKKPLYHVSPGNPVYSVGSYGCNLHCRFCQNADISQQRQPTAEVLPEQLVAEARSIAGNIGVAFTYNEPGIWYEYILDCAPLLRKLGLMTIMVTNGYLNPQPWLDLCRVTDAMNIDLKAFNRDFYEKICGGRLDTVQQNIRTAVEAGVHVELTHLVVTGLNDRPEEFAALVEWVAGISDLLPLHISRYFPRYHENAPPTTPATINTFVEMARARLKYVYPGNLPGQQDTSCPDCKTVWVRRNNYETTVLCRNAVCDCGLPLPFLSNPRVLPAAKG